MATRAAVLRDWPESGEQARVRVGRLLTIWDADPTAREVVIAGADMVAARASDRPDAWERLRGARRIAVTLNDLPDPAGDRLNPIPPLPPQVALAIGDDADGWEQARLNRKVAVGVRDGADGDERVALGPRQLPALREPEPGETPGTVNVIGNPSAEIDLAGWSTSAGATLSRDDADPWAGEWAVQVDIDASTTPTVRIAGVDGFMLANEGPWITSVYGAGDLSGLSVRVRFEYTDSSVGIGDTGLIDEGDLDSDVVVPGPAWTRLASDPAWPDPAKAIANVSVSVAFASQPGARTCWLDGAQAERATEGGATAYIDGDQPGGAWAGRAHAALSWREPGP